MSTITDITELSTNAANLTQPPEFQSFPKMARLSREAIISEKIDGTNGQILITEYGDMFVGSRSRWITPEDDNFGFAAWAYGNREELLKLGPGRHFGEWWGSGIQRNYGLKERRWSLFNTIRWVPYGSTPKQIPTADPRIEKYQEVLPECCHLVPVLYRGEFDTMVAANALDALRLFGSAAAPGFREPEGVVVFHTAANVAFKKTLDKDDEPKGKK
jgi:hypothetical protein